MAATLSDTIVVKTGDTWPPLTLVITESCQEDSTGAYLDDDGNFIRRVDLNTTPPDSIRLILKNGITIVEGAMINAEDVDGSDANDPDIGTVPGNRGEVRYIWAAGDTDDAGTYAGEVEVTWDNASTPPAIETFPNDPDRNYTVIMKADLD